MTIFKRIEAFGIDYVAGQLKSHKDQIVTELKVLVPEGSASLPALNAALEQHVSIFLRPIVDGVLAQVEAEAEAGVTAATVDVPAFIDKLVAELEAEAAKLRA